MSSEIILSLLDIKGVGSATVNKIIIKLGGSISSYEKLSSEMKGKLPAPGEWRDSVDASRSKLSAWSEAGIHALTTEDRLYPATLRNAPFAPPILYARGNIEVLSRPAIAVIGTRKPSRIGAKAAERIGEHFATEGFSLVNGLADGVDWQAVALSDVALSSCIAVAGCGLDYDTKKIASTNFTDRAIKVVGAGGVVVSEFQPGTQEDQYKIISSCKVQAALSCGMIMIQSRTEGGTKFAVEHFSKLEREFHYLAPPAAESNEDAFSANRMFDTLGKDFYKDFIGLSGDRIKSNTHRIASRKDYPDVAERIRAIHEKLQAAKINHPGDSILF